MKPNFISIWLTQIRAPFLLLPVMLIAISGALAHKDQVFHFNHFLLSLLGVILAHIGVNLVNEYSDYHTGIDAKTQRTPFSGGSGNLQAGFTKPQGVLWTALLIMAIAFVIGLYLSWQSGWPLMIIVVLGGLVVFLYTNVLAKLALGELAAGLCLGSLVVIGGYYAQSGTITTQLLLLSIPPGILTALLLLLNEFPDAKADAEGGRRHLVIILGHHKAAIVYTSALFSCYVFLIAGVILNWFPASVLLGLLTLPLALKASRTAMTSATQFEKMIPAQAANVGIVLGTDLLIAIGFLIK